MSNSQVSPLLQTAQGYRDVQVFSSKTVFAEISLIPYWGEESFERKNFCTKVSLFISCMNIYIAQA